MRNVVPFTYCGIPGTVEIGPDGQPFWIQWGMVSCGMAAAVSGLRRVIEKAVAESQPVAVTRWS